MSGKHVPPSIDLKSFSCPVCGAHADQTWFVVRASENDKPPLFPDPEKIAQRRKELKREEAEHWVPLLDRLERVASGAVFLYKYPDTQYSGYEVQNVHISRCYSCGEITLWKHDTILYPRHRFEVEPNADLPEDIRIDFNEAREVLDVSPRAAAALLRLSIQKLCRHLGEPGKDINTDIGALVAKGLDVRVQKALDIVRVVGNNAVHPGVIDLRDDRETAAKLFTLVNRIAYDTITHPREVDALFDSQVPQRQKDQIARRDGSSS